MYIQKVIQNRKDRIIQMAEFLEKIVQTLLFFGKLECNLIGEEESGFTNRL